MKPVTFLTRTILVISVPLCLTAGLARSNGPQQAPTGEHRFAKGGKLERPSKVRVQKFAAAARRALQQYRLQLNFIRPQSQQLAPSGTRKFGSKAGTRAATAGDPLFSWRSVISFNSAENQGQCGSCYTVHRPGISR